MSRPLSLRVVLVTCLLAFSASTALAQGRTDVLVLENGDRVTCEIKGLERGKLTIKTDSMGTFQVEWQDVEQITSADRFQVELESGERFVGSFQATPGSEQLAVVDDASTTTHPHALVVRIIPLGESFWSRLDGSFGLGLNLTKANDTKEYNVAFEVEQRGQRFETRVRFDSLFSSREGIDNTSRHVAEVQVSRLLARRWFWAAVGQVQRNEELQLDFRSLAGAGMGRHLVQNNRTILRVLGGLSFNQEQFTGEDASHNAEAFVSVQFQKFTFDDPEVDITTSTIAFFDLSEAGRVRIDLNASVRRELVKDFFLNVSFFDNFDSEPPASVVRNDYGLVTSFGWSF